MNKYTKQITAVAVMALFAPWANAQVNVDGLGTVNGVPTGLPAGTPGPLTIGEETSVVVTAGVDANLSGNIPVPTAPNSFFAVTRSYERNDAETTTGKTEIDADGNVTLSAGTNTVSGTQTGVVGTDVFLAAKFDIYPDGDPQEGLPIPGTEEYVLVVEDPTAPGTYIEQNTPAGGPFLNAPDLETALNAASTADYAALYITADVYDSEVTGTNGGNLQVGGDANVDGVLSLADTGSGAVADVAAAISDNAAGLVTLQADVDQNELDSDAADAALQADIDQNELDSDAADAALQADIDQNELDSDAADAALQADIDQNELDSDAADAALQADIDQNEIDSDNADIALQADIDQNELDSDNADAALQADIDQNEADTDALIRREADGIHIGDDSFILDDVAFDHRLTTNSGDYLVLGGGANGTDVWVDGDLEVSGDANFQNDVFVDGDVFIGGSATGVQAQLDANADAIDKNKKGIEQNERGIAMVAALQHTTVLPGMTNALDVAAAHFEGETGMSINYARRINENWQINFGAASTTDFDESVIKAGVGVQW